jgi:hypothetical protein
MKSLLALAIAALFIVQVGFAQDIVTRKSGDEIRSKVLEVTVTEIKYKRSDNPDGPVYSILKSDVDFILYENGTKDTFNEDYRNETVVITTYSGPDLYVQGQLDAGRYYQGYKGAATATLGTGLLSPLVGLAPAIACSATEPGYHKLNLPNPELMKKSEYYNGYMHKAKRIKQVKVWSNWTAAFSINLFAYLIIMTYI